MSSGVMDDLRSFRRSWVHHTGMQLATLTVLAATLSVVVFVMSLSLNLKRVLSSWGDGVQMTVYLKDSVDEEAATALREKLASLSGIASIDYVPREVATENFKRQMASYAPDLLADADFANPFPASFRLSLKKGVAEGDVDQLDTIASSVRTIGGVEDVSYGESWVRNYSAFVSTLNASGATMAAILLMGSLLVVGNSIRASISARRDEIEILELVGATSSMIRRPFVTEGLIMGALAGSFAILANLGLHFWQKSMLASSLALARVLPFVTFLDFILVAAVILGAAALGAFGAWLTVRRINDGWSARQAMES